jgi:hypothetical protein
MMSIVGGVEGRLQKARFFFEAFDVSRIGSLGNLTFGEYREASMPTSRTCFSCHLLQNSMSGVRFCKELLGYA